MPNVEWTRKDLGFDWIRQPIMWESLFPEEGVMRREPFCPEVLFAVEIADAVKEDINLKYMGNDHVVNIL